MEKDPAVVDIIEFMRGKGIGDSVIAAAFPVMYKRLRGSHSRLNEATGVREAVPASRRKSVLQGKCPSTEELETVYGLNCAVPDKKPEEPVNMNIVEGMKAASPEPAPVNTGTMFAKWKADKDLSLWLDAEGIDNDKALMAALDNEGVENVDDFERWIKDRWAPKHVKQRTVEG